MKDEAELLRQVFGDSSDDDDDNNFEGINLSGAGFCSIAGESADSGLCGNPSWERVKEIRGLWVCRDFLSPLQQLSLLSAIQIGGFFS